MNKAQGARTPRTGLQKQAALAARRRGDERTRRWTGGCRCDREDGTGAIYRGFGTQSYRSIQDERRTNLLRGFGKWSGQEVSAATPSGRAAHLESIALLYPELDPDHVFTVRRWPIASA